MKTTHIDTENLLLTLRSPAEVQADIESLDPATKKQLSPDWLQRVYAATSADPWLHGFALVHRVNGISVGTAGFKASQSEDGSVEIAYRVSPEHQGRGYATEAAAALTDFAFRHDQVRLVRAHTLPEPNASTRVLTKCGFRCIGEVIDPEDGLVWRWEKERAAV